MIITKEQAEQRTSSENNIVNVLEKTRETLTNVTYKDHINNHKGKGEGTRNLTENERIAIGVVASLTDSKTAAEIFQISPSHANDLKNGNRNVGAGEHNTSLRVQDNNLTQQIEKRLENTRLSIHERAAEKLLNALDLISPDKLENCSAKDLASISNQMAQVVKHTSSSQDNSGNNGKPNIKIVVHQPRPSREENFDYIEVGVSS